MAGRALPATLPVAGRAPAAMRHVISTPMATSNTRRKKHREAQARKGGGKSGTWAMALFALPFAAVGVGMLLFGVLPTLYDWGRMQGWQPVPATLVSARLETSRGSKSTTYSVSASYRYQVGGRDYQGQRVAIGSGADNIGDFQEQLGERLEAAQREGQPVQAWVNPSNPHEAVLDRSLRPGMQLFKMLFVVLFGGVGLGMLHGAWRGPRAGRGTQALEASAQPWMGRPAWAGNSIRSNKRYEVWVAWTFALVCNAIAWPSAIAHRDEALDGPQYLLVAVFGALLLAAVATLVWAVRATLDAWRFGDVRLVLDPFPGAIGGDFGATLALPVAHRPGQQHFAVTLSCVRHYRSRTGGKSESRETTVWQSQGVAQVEPRGDGIQLGLRLRVPAGLPATEPLDSEHHAWRLQVESADPGLRFLRVFDVPVYATGATSHGARADAAQHPQLREMRHAEVAAVSELERIPGGVRLYLPYGRAWKQTIVWMLAGAVFVGIAALAGGQDVPVLFLIAFGGLGGAAVVGGFYAVANSLSVELDGRGIRTERRLLGLMLVHHQAPATDIARLRVAESYSTQTGARQETFYRIEVELRNGKRLTVADSLRGRAAADHLLASIASQTGYPR